MFADTECSNRERVNLSCFHSHKTSVMVAWCFIFAVRQRTQVWEPVTILRYCLSVDLSLDHIWVCTTAVIEKPPVQRDERDIAVHAVTRTQWFCFTA